MLQLLKINTDLKTHSEHFVERYDRLLGWALHLTDHDRAQAEDLLHDAFIQFTLAAPEIGGIRNLDNYLFGVLRILRVSQLRRNARLRFEQLSIIEYDSAELGLRMIEAQTSTRVQDELRAICRYACARKETSKAGSVLILRFFHGYYPGEIAAVLLSSRKVADMRLQAARREARAYLSAPERLSFISAPPKEKRTNKREADMTTQTADDLLVELRNEIFAARTGECFSRGELQQMYKSDEADAIGNDGLSHIVSCATCLDAVNQILGLPTLAERHPNDTLDKDKRGQNGGGDGGSGGSGSSGADAIKRQSQQRAREVFEHRPQELYVAVNGFILGSQAIHAEINEQTLELRESDLNEPPSFVEVFSEQGLRLLLMPIEPPGEEPEQKLRIELSDGRELELNLQHGIAQPMLNVVYCDPLMNEGPTNFSLSEAFADIDLRQTEVCRTPAWPRGLLTRISAAHSVWQPGVVAATLGLLLAAMAIVSIWRWPGAPAVTAAELLQKSVAAETQVAAARGQATHRGFRMEERDAASGRVVASHRIEVWQSADQGLAVRRLYDAQNRVITGEWKQTDGSSKFYLRKEAAASDTERAESKAEMLLVHYSDWWRTALAAQSFAELVQTATAKLEEQKDVYVLSYQFPADGANGRPNQLLRASLTLRKSDLRAIEQTEVFRLATDDGRLREYRAVETAFEQLPAGDVPAAAFQPDAELMAGECVNQSTPNSKPIGQVIPNPEAKPAVNLTALEIEARYLLDGVNANLGEQVSIRREGDRLRISALVETDKRKAELLTALVTLRASPVTLDIATYAEAARRQSRSSQSTAAPTISEFEAAQDQIPAAADLRRYFTAQSPNEKPNENIEARIAEFANRIQSQAMKPLRHARALRTLVEQIAPAELEQLNPEAKVKWRRMLQTHALAVERETAALRAQLQPIFFAAAEPDSLANSSGELNLKQAVERLVELTANHDAVIGQAFARSVTPASAAMLKSPQFRQSLLEAEAMAKRISTHQ